MRVCLKECKDAELVRSSVPIARENDIYENTQPEIEHCSDGIAPQPNTAVDGSQKMIAPVVVSMTKYLFAHYRLQMYAYLNNSLRSGMLKRIVGFSFTNRTINREVCTFKGVNYWRMDRLNFWADVSVTLLLSTAEGKREWCGYLCFWFSAEQLGPLTGTIEELTSVKDGPERSGMTLLSPFLIPYFTAAKIDMEAENIWAACIPGALDHPELRKAEMLAGAMGLSILHLPLHKHEEVDSILFLVDDQIEIAEKGKQPEIREIPANTIVINTSNIKKEYSDFNILHECMVYVKETSECAFIPRMVFTRLTKTTTRMDTAYIKDGENRYTVNFSDVAGGLYKSPYYANLASEPFGPDGAAMIYDMAFSGKEVKILMGDSEEAVVSSNQLLKLKSYYETCQKAGVFNTEYFASYSDNYEARIILNK